MCIRDRAQTEKVLKYALEKGSRNIAALLPQNAFGLLLYDTITSLIVHFAVIVPVGFTNAIFMDAERENAPWIFKWRTEQNTYKLWQKIRKPNYEKRIPWDIDKEA